MTPIEKRKSITEGRILDIKETVKDSPERKKEIMDAYKKIFSGHPWEEEYICKNALVTGPDGKQKCNAVYRSEACEEYDVVPGTGEIINDCRGEFAKRENIFLLSSVIDGLCKVCKEKLEVIEFYPEYVDYIALFNEALSEEGFIGKVFENENRTIAFSWGYRLPNKRTSSVRFDLLGPIFEQKGITPENTFYAAETGVVQEFRKIGIGTLVSSERVLSAYNQGYTYLITRTINPYTVEYFKKIFSGTDETFLTHDPERGSDWYMWKFKDMNKGYASSKLSNLMRK
ncbi:MAG: hypothetical protein M1360_01485 [Candidatus Marsarchaeota archaeon]|jgi:hypothetical protein|nr:hypothetical protein [Candidatus Marsarchaeota archaeon]MCL5418594.1 hypothetical protein [Candidatus Marsarchaeota archaeon]